MRALGAVRSGVATMVLCLSAGSWAPGALGAQVSGIPPEAVRPLEVAAATPRQDVPSWVGPGVPDTVWLLVEASAAAADRERARVQLAEAEAWARASLEGFGEEVDRHFALAVVLGLRADREGGRTRVTAAAELHRTLETILAMDPTHARAHHLMGRLHAGVRRMNRVTRWIATKLLGGGVLSGASWEAAEEHLTLAERRAPEVPEHHLQLANLYRDTGRATEAIEEALHVLEREASTPMERATYREAAALVEELSDERVPDQASNSISTSDWVWDRR